MKIKYMKVLSEIQDICKEEKCCESCQFLYGRNCLFILIPKYWELDKFRIEE